MPESVSRVLDVLGDPVFVSLVALGVSLLSLTRARRLSMLQARIADLELEDRVRVESSRTRGDVHAELISFDAMNHRLVLKNAGAGPAFAVDIEFLEDKAAGILADGERETKLPIAQLGPGRSVGLVAALAVRRWPPFKVELTWKNADGARQRKETLLYDQV